MKLRLRVTRVLVVPAVVLAVVTQNAYSEGSLAGTLLESAGVILLVLSATGRIWAGAYVTGRKNRTLVTDGPFSLVRNPLYFFSFLGFLGAGLAFGSIVLTAVFALTFFIAHWPTIGSEERVLEELFGDAYRSYRSQVPRFIPAFQRPRSEGVVELEASGFSRMLSESAAIPLVLVAVELLEWARLNEWIPVLLRFP